MLTLLDYTVGVYLSQGLWFHGFCYIIGCYVPEGSAIAYVPGLTRNTEWGLIRESQ